MGGVTLSGATKNFFRSGFHHRFPAYTRYFSTEFKPFLPNTQQKTTQHLPSSYVVCIGGGTVGRRITKIWEQNFPERAEYFDVCGLANHLIGMEQVKPENLSLFFGNGEVSPKVLVHSKLKKFFINLFSSEKVSCTETKTPFPVPHEAASLKNIEAACERLSKVLTPNDKLSILLTGHGSPSRGMVLWNEKYLHEFLSPAALNHCLEKFNQHTNITVFVSSCYSGQYLPLTRRNIVVLSTSGFDSLSRYSGHTGCEHLQRLFGFDVWNYILEDLNGRKYLSQHSFHVERFLKQYEGLTLLQRQAKEAMNKNFYASDSLSYYVDQTLERKVGADRVRLPVEKIQHALSNRRFQMGAELGFAGLIIFDPSGLFQTLFIGKMGLAVGKAALPAIKLAGWIFMRGTFIAVEETAKSSPLYVNWFTMKDRRLIQRVESFLAKQNGENKVAVGSAPLSAEINWIFQDLYKIEKFPIEKNKPLVRYHYLSHKARLFLSLATPEELETLVSIYKTLSQNDSLGKIPQLPKRDADLY